MKFAGHAALFDKRDAGRDIIRPGAFAHTLAERSAPIPLLWQHYADRRIGWIEDAREDALGLAVTASLDDHHTGVAAALRAGKVTGLSFGFRARDFTRDAAGRELRAVELVEVSLVTHPMQPAARVASISQE